MPETILVIEDEKELRTNIFTLLSENGYSAEAVKDAEAALNKLKHSKFDLIISDIMLPGMDGYQLLRELKKAELAVDIPFIFLTAKVDIADLRLGMEEGADDYLFKPFKAADLLNSVQSRLRRFNAIKDAAKINSEVNTEVERYTPDSRIYVEHSSNPSLIKIADIKHISAENQYSVIHLNESTKHLVRKSLAQWERELPENCFFRIHRSTIVNLNKIIKIERWINSRIHLYLEEIDHPVIVSKRYVSKLKSMQKK